MIAPIDARATVVAGEDKVELVLNFRTIALAADAGVDLLAGKVELDGVRMVKVIAAFAVPAQPDFDEEQAFALVARHGSACGQALGKLFEQFAAAVPTGGDTDPPKRRAKPPAS